MPLKDKRKSSGAEEKKDKKRVRNNKWQVEETKAAAAAAQKKKKRKKNPGLIVRKGEASSITAAAAAATTAAVSPVVPALQSWSDCSNVGNLSIREKSVLAIVIFSFIVLSWVFSFCFSVCGSSSFGSTQYQQDLTMCKATWSSLATILPDTTSGGGGAAATGLLQQQMESLTNRMGHVDQVNRVLQTKLQEEQYEIRNVSDELQTARMETKSVLQELEDLKRATRTDVATVKALSAKCLAQTSELTKQLQQCETTRTRVEQEMQNAAIRLDAITSKEHDGVRDDALKNLQAKHDELLLQQQQQQQQQESTCKSSSSSSKSADTVVNETTKRETTEQGETNNGTMKRQNPIVHFFFKMKGMRKKNR